METQSSEQSINTSKQSQIPNSNGVLAMGIISLICILCMPAGLIGIVLAILAIVLGSNAIKQYKTSPDQYTLKSFKNAKAGKVCGIISLSFIGLTFITLIIVASVVGWAIIGTFITTMPWDMM